jgi:hypothetical protein
MNRKVNYKLQKELIDMKTYSNRHGGLVKKIKVMEKPDLRNGKITQ